MKKLFRFPKRMMRCLVILFMLILPTLLQTCWMLVFVPSASMSPSLEPGDFLVGVRHPNEFSRGDILVFRGHDKQILIKRLIGLPGEKVIITENGDVFIDELLLNEPYVKNDPIGTAYTFHVPDGQLLFLGDNRGDSLDARYWENAYISTKNVMAKAHYKILPEIRKLEDIKDEHRYLPI